MNSAIWSVCEGGCDSLCDSTLAACPGSGPVTPLPPADDIRALSRQWTRKFRWQPTTGKTQPCSVIAPSNYLSFEVPSPFSEAGTSPKAALDPALTNWSKIYRPYDRRKIYAVIVDVKSYPEFIPYCLFTTILESTSADNRSPNNHVAINPSIENPRSTQNLLAKEDDYRAEEFRVLTRIGYKGFETDYHSHVICQPFESVRVIAQPSATFTTLTTTWKLSDPPSTATLTPEALKDTTQVQLDLSFKFKNPIHEFLLTDELIWKKFSTLVIQSFQDRLSGLK
ncbi:hypothetical protein PCASD_09917 [Puccinia coronata f. sp. avenae]|uniref:Coenzyme Q-binding protein COQ10 START domain-containing protein n=1 Tax=Puccinia coronata f. sp. avenae TaxID=200324 RepID=A0A2N5UI41_9BASI|nr:hypothetical protein PCASD_09917 [Puccinia coronata f. sp. avenae]